MLVKQRPVISIACIAISSCHSFSKAAAEGLYEILGLERSASSEDIKSAFRKVSCTLKVVPCAHGQQ
jgi:curved DNA-binding protein CbpA